MASFTPTSSVSSFPAVGFSGSRRPCTVASAACSRFLGGLFPRYRGRVFAGCAVGIDRLVREAVPASQLSVFSVQRQAGQSVPAWAFAARSARMVSELRQSGGVLVAFPSGSCPLELVPCSSWRSARGSGTWGSVALALGLGCPVLVFAPFHLSGSFPSPAAVGSRFSCLGSARSGSWWFAAAPSPSVSAVGVGSQASLF